MRPTSYLLWKLKIIVVLVVCFSFSLSLLSRFMFDILLQEHPSSGVSGFNVNIVKNHVE